MLKRSELRKIVKELKEACEQALSYFEDTRHGREWIEGGGVEAEALRKALRFANKDLV